MVLGGLWDLYGFIWIYDVSVGFILGREPLISSSSSIGVVPLAGLFGLKVDRFETFMLSPHHPQANKSAYGYVLVDVLANWKQL